MHLSNKIRLKGKCIYVLQICEYFAPAMCSNKNIKTQLMLSINL